MSTKTSRRTERSGSPSCYGSASSREGVETLSTTDEGVLRSEHEVVGGYALSYLMVPHPPGLAAELDRAVG